MGFLVVDCNRVVVSVQPVDECLDGGFVEMAEVGGGLSGFLAHH